MRKQTLAIIVTVIIFGGLVFWFYKQSQTYGAMKSVTRSLPFTVVVPTHLPKGFVFLEKESLALSSGNRAGIPQINFLFESGGDKNGLALKQHARNPYETEVLRLSKSIDLAEYFQRDRNMKRDERDGQTIYAKISSGKEPTMFGENKYTGAVVFLTSEIVVELDYYGDEPVSYDELVETILSLKPF